jgi:hypothetical protein
MFTSVFHVLVVRAWGKSTTETIFLMFSASHFNFLFEYLRRCALAFSGKSLQHVSSKNAGAGKLCASLHEIENRLFSLAADDGQAAYVYNHLAAF